MAKEIINTAATMYLTRLQRRLALTAAKLSNPTKSYTPEPESEQSTKIKSPRNSPRIYSEAQKKQQKLRQKEYLSMKRNEYKEH